VQPGQAVVPHRTRALSLRRRPALGIVAAVEKLGTAELFVFLSNDIVDDGLWVEHGLLFSSVAAPILSPPRRVRRAAAGGFFVGIWSSASVAGFIAPQIANATNAGSDRPQPRARRLGTVKKKTSSPAQQDDGWLTSAVHSCDPLIFWIHAFAYPLCGLVHTRTHVRVPWRRLPSLHPDDAAIYQGSSGNAQHTERGRSLSYVRHPVAFLTMRNMSWNG
jgi:hypothetical protein